MFTLKGIKSTNQSMGKLELITSHIEEQPQYYDFIKNDFVGRHPTMANLDYDPFPDKALTDVVRTEIVARKLVLRAKLKGDVFHLNPGIALQIDGRKFGIVKSEIRIDMEGDNSIADVEGEAMLTSCEPLKVLAQLRAALVRKQQN